MRPWRGGVWEAHRGQLVAMADASGRLDGGCQSRLRIAGSTCTPPVARDSRTVDSETSLNALGCAGAVVDQDPRRRRCRAKTAVVPRSADCP